MGEADRPRAKRACPESGADLTRKRVWHLHLSSRELQVTRQNTVVQTQKQEPDRYNRYRPDSPKNVR